MTDNNMKTIAEMDTIIANLEKQGIVFDAKVAETEGLGDLVEKTLKKFGVTEERFKEWFNLKECNCTKRKKWLNNLFSWVKK